MPVFRFGSFSLDTDRRELRRDDSPLAVEPQVFDLIAYLVERRDRVVSKDELLDAIWPGRIVTESTLTSRINAARVALGDSGARQQLIRTHARKGFRFLGTVLDARVVEVIAPNPQTAVTASDAEGPPSIAVLPFANLSGDESQEYFSDGITEDLITALVRYRSLIVIARNSSFALGRQVDDVRRVGRELGAAYIVQGSVRSIGARVRITAQLVETATGHQIWGEQYDCDVAEIFDVQDEITARITGRLAPEVERAEQGRADRRSPRAFTAWDCFRLGTRQFYRATAEGNQEAERLFRQALALDPGLAEAHGFLAYAIVLSMIYFDELPREERLDEAIEISRRGVALDERDALVRFMYGRALLARRRYDEALDELRIAVDLNPNLAVAHCGLGDSLAYEGLLADAIPHFERAIDLSPHDPLRWAFCAYRALAHLLGGEFKDAEDWARRATRVPNCHYWAFAHRVAALGHLVDPASLEVARADLFRLRPGFSCRIAQQRLFYIKDPRHVALYVEGLRLGGVPET